MITAKKNNKVVQEGNSEGASMLNVVVGEGLSEQVTSEQRSK